MVFSALHPVIIYDLNERDDPNFTFRIQLVACPRHLSDEDVGHSQPKPQAATGRRLPSFDISLQARHEFHRRRQYDSLKRWGNENSQQGPSAHAEARLDKHSVSCNLRLVETYIERVLDALGDPTRRSVFERLRSGPRSVGEIAQGMDVTRPAVSQHLKVLKEVRLVVDRPEGTRRLYGVEVQGLKALRSWLDGFWDEALAAFKEAAEREIKKKEHYDEQSDGT